MSTSEYGGIIEYDPAELAADEPMDTPLVRRVINNANHYADQAGQVVCNWVAIDSGLGGKPMGLVYPDEILEEMFGGAGTWTKDTWFRFGMVARWDAKVRDDGTGYRLRVRLDGGIDPSNGTAVDYAIVVGPAGMTEADVGAAYRATSYITGVTTASQHALTLDGGDTWIDVPDSVVGAARDAGSHQTTAIDLGGEAVTMTTARMEVMVCGRGVDVITAAPASVENAPVLYRMHVAEYIGP